MTNFMKKRNNSLQVLTKPPHNQMALTTYSPLSLTIHSTWSNSSNQFSETLFQENILHGIFYYNLWTIYGWKKLHVQSFYSFPEDVFNTWLFEKFRYQMPCSLVEKIKKSKQSERNSIKFPSSGAYSVYLIFCFCIGEFCGIENIASLWKPRREDGWQKKCVSVVNQ